MPGGPFTPARSRGKNERGRSPRGRSRATGGRNLDCRYRSQLLFDLWWQRRQTGRTSVIDEHAAQALYGIRKKVKIAGQRIKRCIIELATIGLPRALRSALWAANAEVEVRASEEGSMS